jgi:hypothetical protein
MDAGQSPGRGPSVCPFVALAEDRDRRADEPDKGNRCYAEPAPRQRDLLYQADYCYSKRFSSCSVFLAWAARNAAEPAYITEAAQKAWGSGIAVPDGEAAGESEGGALPAPEAGLFGPDDGEDAGADAAEGTTSETFDWVSASAWADVPYDEHAEAEADELETLVEEEPLEAEAAEEDESTEDEALQAPRVPAALPMRRRRRPLRPIKTRGSGEWFYADPLDHEPLVRRRYGIAPPILLAVLGLLVVAIVVVALPTIFSGGDPGAVASPSPGATFRPLTTRPPLVRPTPEASLEPGPTATPKIRTYKVKPGDSLTGIAVKFGVDPKHLQCMNGIKNKNIVVLGSRLRIPPEGYTCPPGWRKATPEPG